MVDLPATWRAVLDRSEIVTAESESLLPFAVAGDGGWLFAADYTPEWSGVIAISAGGRQRRRIKPFAKPEDQITGGGFDGRWVVWSESHSLSSYDDWSLHAWDTAAGQLRNIASAPRQGDRPIPSPPIFPQVDHGWMAWSQPVPAGHIELHLYSLAAAADRIVASGQLGGPVFAWPWLIWPERVAVGAPHILAMAAAETGERFETARPLAAIRAPVFLAGAPGAVAWSDVRTLWAWHAGDEAATQIFAAPTGDAAQFPQIAGQLLTWQGAQASFVADLRTRSLVQLTDQPTNLLARERGLALNYRAKAGQARTLHPAQRVLLLTIDSLPPLPSCG